MHQMQAWLSTCLEKHTSCPRFSAETLPTRLIDVGDPIGYSVSVVTTTESSRGEWFALSHCWGRAPQPIVATRSNIHELSKILRLSQLSGTVRDAIAVTRALGVQYLWVDLLCILQDDIADWARESSRMCEYYKNSKACLVAADGVDSGHGFLESGAADVAKYLSKRIEMPFVNDAGLQSGVLYLDIRDAARKQIGVFFRETAWSYTPAGLGIPREHSVATNPGIFGSINTMELLNALRY